LPRSKAQQKQVPSGIGEQRHPLSPAQPKNWSRQTFGPLHAHSLSTGDPAWPKARPTLTIAGADQTRAAPAPMRLMAERREIFSLSPVIFSSTPVPDQAP
jgi:hypothetical protein